MRTDLEFGPPPQPTSTENIFKKMEKISGISIKRVRKECETVYISSDEEENLLEEIEVPENDQKPTIINTGINYSCGFCKKSFKTFDILTSHMKSKICFVDYFSCNECDKHFKNKKTLYNHKKTHKTKQKVMCESCGKEFNSQHDLVINVERFSGIQPTIYLISFRTSTLNLYIAELWKKIALFAVLIVTTH